MRTAKLGSLKTIVSFDSLSKKQTDELTERGLHLRYFDDLTKKNNSHPTSTEVVVDPEECLTFSYTSGTTGFPKGAMLSHRNFASFCAVVDNRPDLNFPPGYCYLSYLPLAHMFERLVLYLLIYKGATIVYESGYLAPPQATSNR